MITHESYIRYSGNPPCVFCYYRWDCCSVVPPASPPAPPPHFLLESLALLTHINWNLTHGSKSFPSLVLLEATKHLLSWSAIPFSSSSSVSYLSPRHTPSPASLCVSPAHWHLNFPSASSPPFISISFTLTFTQSVYHVFSISPTDFSNARGSILSQMDWWTIQLWISLSLCLFWGKYICTSCRTKAL